MLYFSQKAIFFNFFNITEKYLKESSVSSIGATCDFCVPLLCYLFKKFSYSIYACWFYARFFMTFFLSLKGTILSEVAIRWTAVSERAGEVSQGNRQLHYFFAVSILFLKFLPGERVLHTSLRDVPIQFTYLTMDWEFMFINFTLPVLNSNCKIATDCHPLFLSLCCIANLSVAKMVRLPHSSFSLTLPVTLHNLLFQIRNQWSGALGLCSLPLQNSMPCLRSLKICIYYT